MSSLTGQAKSLFAAIGFLTALPVPSRWMGGRLKLSASAAYFPLVGLGIGALVALFDQALMLAFRAPLLAGAGTAVALVGVSRALHLDGLADTADGFLSGRPPARMLEIMRDSRVGAMGVTAVVCVILLKVCALYALPLSSRFWAVLMMPLAGRSALVFQLAILPYARRKGGLAAVFVERCGPAQLVLTALFLALVGWVGLGWPGLVAAGSTAGMTALLCLYCHGKIGGLTGDTLGAGCELAELVPLLAVLLCEGRC